MLLSFFSLTFVVSLCLCLLVSLSVYASVYFLFYFGCLLIFISFSSTFCLRICLFSIFLFVLSMTPSGSILLFLSLYLSIFLSFSFSFSTYFCHFFICSNFVLWAQKQSHFWCTNRESCILSHGILARKTFPLIRLLPMKQIALIYVHIIFWNAS
jgi:hypothetical protein